MMRVICVLLSPGAPVQFLAECCLRLSPQIAVGEHWFFLEVGKCRSLYSEETILKRLRVLLSRFGIFGNLSIADDLPTALAFARFQGREIKDLPVRALKDYLHPFSYSSSLDMMLGQLDKLGVYTVGEFLELPSRTLLTRFGKEGLWAHRQVQERQKIVWPYFKIEKKLSESLILPSAPPVIESLLFHLKTLTDRVASRLLGRGQRVSRFELAIHQESFSHIKERIRRFTFDLPLAQSSGLSLLSLIRERLSTKLSIEPLQSELEFIEIRVLETVPLKTTQRDLIRRDDEEQESWASLLSRLDEKLGQRSTFFARASPSYLPEKAWTSTKIHRETTTFFQFPSPKRPLRLINKPIPLRRENSFLSHSQETWKVLNIQGPERIREEWWQKQTERDYYVVQAKSQQTHKDETLWIFQRNSPQLFLHGFFD